MITAIILTYLAVQAGVLLGIGVYRWSHRQPPRDLFVPPIRRWQEDWWAGRARPTEEQLDLLATLILANGQSDPAAKASAREWQRARLRQQQTAEQRRSMRSAGEED
jgi:hypothetical protein